MSKPELISDYPHSELNLGVERRRMPILPKAVEREISKRPIITTTAVLLLASAAAGVAVGLMMRANEKAAARANGSAPKKRSITDILGL